MSYPLITILVAVFHIYFLIMVSAFFVEGYVFYFTSSHNTQHNQ